jgi:hypothetical protein
MKTTEKQASKRLFKKLSALRATLSNEERAILDNLIVNEVAAHKMTDRAVGKATTRATNKATSKNTFRIAFDPNSEEYRIQD